MPRDTRHRRLLILLHGGVGAIEMDPGCPVIGSPSWPAAPHYYIFLPNPGVHRYAVARRAHAGDRVMATIGIK